MLKCLSTYFYHWLVVIDNLQFLLTTTSFKNISKKKQTSIYELIKIELYVINWFRTWQVFVILFQIANRIILYDR